jgi:two-component system, NtrC family, sensor histidine kinase HydH
MLSATRGVRLQAAVVLLLFLGSLGTVLFNTFQTLFLPWGEVRVQDRLQAASARMAAGAEKELAATDKERSGFDDLNARLRSVTDRVLQDFPGVEGGFYLSDGIDRFAGYGFPNGGHEGPAHGPKMRPPHSLRGDDPPPKEVPFILVQARHTLTLGPDDYQVDVRTVGPSRVAIFTEPVGRDRPARLATWTMFRLTRPADLGTQLFHYQISTGLALGGIALAVLLTANLGRTLQRQRLDQERLREELRRSEHLAALGKLLAGVAHEVRNPLAGIRSTVQLWERLPETTRTTGSMTAVIHAVDRLNEIVTRLLFFSRADSAERQPVQINQVLGEILELIKAQAATQAVALDCDLEEGLPAVQGSAGALRQLFLNLATNALQAMPDGGRLLCGTRFQPATRRVEIRFEDTGPGISPESSSTFSSLSSPPVRKEQG